MEYISVFLDTAKFADFWLKEMFMLAELKSCIT